MTSEEIKQSLSPKEVAERYGIKVNRVGQASCPFHADRHPSMKIYKDGFHCFSCGFHGDVFDFIARMDGTDFKSAYLASGGEYKERGRFQSRLEKYRHEQAKKMRLKQEQQRQKKIRLNNDLIDIYREKMRRTEPLSDAWCRAYNAYQLQLYNQCQIHGIEERW